MTERSAKQGTFVIERTIAASPERVFNAFADPKAKSAWFASPSIWEKGYIFEFREGGHETFSGSDPLGRNAFYDAVYHDIVPNERIIYTYEMKANDVRTSVSVATIEFRPEGEGTKMIATEQGMFLDGIDTMEDRQHGMGELFTAMEKSITESV
jgi:uncharacterized protein YndB with AHSA1/START domain